MATPSTSAGDRNRIRILLSPYEPMRSKRQCFSLLAPASLEVRSHALIANRRDMRAALRFHQERPGVLAPGRRRHQKRRHRFSAVVNPFHLNAARLPAAAVYAEESRYAPSPIAEPPLLRQAPVAFPADAGGHRAGRRRAGGDVRGQRERAGGLAANHRADRGRGRAAGLRGRYRHSGRSARPCALGGGGWLRLTGGGSRGGHGPERAGQPARPGRGHDGGSGHSRVRLRRIGTG